jgi:WD40 repeat protein
VKVWNAETGAVLRTLRGHEKTVRCVSFSPDARRIVSGSEDATVKLWDAETGEELRTLCGHGGLVHSVSFSPDGRRIVSGSVDRTVKLWDTETGAELLTLHGHGGVVISVSFSQDARRIVSADGKSVNFWDSVPCAERYRRRQILEAAGPQAEAAVNRKLKDVASETEAIRQIKADSSLPEPVRHMALNMLLQRLDRQQEGQRTKASTSRSSASPS